MATKEENIQRLRELATRLGRAPDVSGSAAELSQRVMEWEEEAEAEAEHLPAVENDSDES
ncbi:TPA: DNA packaging protein, partial [Salmonella enterica subsp. enterica serovar Typhimurium]|nr:DNA packaging protein [Salmonella enterica subsp. enterica serovar Typhimurium]